MALFPCNVGGGGTSYEFYTGITNAVSTTDGSHTISCAIDDIIAVLLPTSATSDISITSGGTIIMSTRTSGGSSRMFLVHATSTSVKYTSASNSVYSICGKQV